MNQNCISDTGLKNGFGSRFSTPNCIYDNVMESIKTKCKCDSLEKCNSADNWKCVSSEFSDPYDKYLEPTQCKDACFTHFHTAEPNSMNMIKDPMCGEWLSVLKNQCTTNQANIESGYSGLCSASSSLTCDSANSADSYSNAPIVKQFAKDKLISMNFYMETYYMEAIYTYFVKDLKSLIDGILLNLVIFFGVSIMSFPELLYYSFCSRGGGCCCKPILQNC